MSEEVCVMDGVTEYGEGAAVELHKDNNGKLLVVAYNEGGYNSTAVDLLDILLWVKTNYPELLSV